MDTKEICRYCNERGFHYQGDETSIACPIIQGRSSAIDEAIEVVEKDIQENLRKYELPDRTRETNLMYAAKIGTGQDILASLLQLRNKEI